MVASTSPSATVLGRYTLYDPIAAGGMATVHIGRLLGPAGFARTVAIKRLHPQYARDPDFVTMFLDEARLAARIRHPNVVQTLDVVALEEELFLVMDYVTGESLSRLMKTVAHQGRLIPLPYAVAIVCGALQGLHAAHEAKGENGEPLGIVHRDVSPQNILVGIDGVPRVLDFGVAKAVGRTQITREGQVKGKMAYIAPEQLRGSGVDRRTDVYAAGVVLWELLTGKRLFAGDNDVEVFGRVLSGKVGAPSQISSTVPTALDDIVLRAVANDPADRFATAREMARALQSTVPLVPTAEIGEWVEETGGQDLAARAQTIVRIESESSAPTHRAPASTLPLSEQSASGVGPVRGSGAPVPAGQPPSVPAPALAPTPAPGPPLAPAPPPAVAPPPPEERTDVSMSALSEEWNAYKQERRRITLILSGSAVAAVIAVILIVKALTTESDTPEAPSASAVVPPSPPESSTSVATADTPSPPPSASTAPTATSTPRKVVATVPTSAPTPAPSPSPAAPRVRPGPAPRPTGGALDGVLDSRH